MGGIELYGMMCEVSKLIMAGLLIAFGWLMCELAGLIGRRKRR